MRRLRERFRQRPLYGDLLLMFAVSPATFLTTLSLLTPHTSRALGLLAGLLFTVPLAVRRTRPDLAAAGIVAAHLLQLLLTDTMLPANLTVPLIIYAVAAYGQQKRARVWLGVAGAGAVVASIDWSFASNYVDAGYRTRSFMAWLVVCVAVVAAAWFGGQAVRQRRLTLQSLRERASALELQRESDRQLAVEEERSRIAREMHDVVAHSLSVIVVQADGAGYLAAEAPGDAEARLAQVRTAIGTISDTARDALAETRRLVGVLRQAGDVAELAPSSSLDSLPDLVDKVAAAGVPVQLLVSGEPASHTPLSAGAEMAAYRVVQESLTNVIKHAGPRARATVLVHHDAEGVHVQVADTGRGNVPSDGAGHGIIGMRERMVAWGGTLTARPRIGGGFEVVADLPAMPAQQGESQQFTEASGLGASGRPAVSEPLP